MTEVYKGMFLRHLLQVPDYGAAGSLLAYHCYCAYVMRISRYSDFLPAVLINTWIFLRGSKLFGEIKAELGKCSWYPRRKVGVTMHFSELIKLQFGNKRHTLLCILKHFTNIVDQLSSKNAWLPPIFFLNFNNTC